MMWTNVEVENEISHKLSFATQSKKLFFSCEWGKNFCSCTPHAIFFLFCNFHSQLVRKCSKLELNLVLASLRSRMNSLLHVSIVNLTPFSRIFLRIEKTYSLQGLLVFFCAKQTLEWIQGWTCSEGYEARNVWKWTKIRYKSYKNF